MKRSFQRLAHPGMWRTRHFFRAAILVMLVLLPGIAKADDTLVGACGFDMATVREVNTDDFREGVNVRIGSAPPAGTFSTCGRFRLTFVDVSMGNNYGFNDPTYGAQRRNCACNVFQYIESIMDIPTGDGSPIDIVFDWSWNTIGLNSPPPQPPGMMILGQAAPNFTNISNGFQGGDVYDHITTGNDPNPSLNMDGWLRINFDNSNPPYPTWNSNCGVNTTGCTFDLYSVMLHEATHTLGWLSFLEDDVNHFPMNGNGVNPNMWSKYDEFFVYQGTPITGTLTKVLNNSLLAPQTGVNSLISENLWMQDNTAAYTNDPVNSPNPFKPGTSISHYDDWQFSFERRAWLTPQFSPRYVMSWGISIGDQRREYSNQELRAFLTMGYFFKTSFTTATTLNPLNTSMANSTVITNKPAHYDITQKQVITPYSYSYPENNTTVDYTTTVCNPVVIDLSNPATLAALKISDPDGDPVSVYPGSLYNIRGCGNGGNNHNQVVVSSSGQLITFTPRTNFIGRAQFGFHLYDDHELGAFYVITIEVSADGCFSCGSNMIVNGDFEEGTEIKTASNPNGTVNSRILYSRNGRYDAGHHFADACPYSLNFWTGTVVQGAYSSCTFGWPTDAYSPGWAPPSPAGGSRHKMVSQNGNYLTLCTPIQNCKQYTLEFDVYASTASLPITFDATNYTPGYVIPLYNQSFSYTLTLTPNAWNHVVLLMNSCCSTSSNFLHIRGGANSFYLDNMNLYLTPVQPVASATASASQSTICTGQSTNLSVTPSNFICPASTFTWMPGSLSGQNVTVSPASTTTYTVTVTNSCSQVATASVTITVNTTPTITAVAIPATICSGGSANLWGIGATSYLWQPGSLTGSPAAASPTNTTTYTVTGTANGCSSTATCTLTVNPTPTVSVSASSSTICAGNSTTLTGSGATTYTWMPGSLTGTSVVVSPATTTTYTVTGTTGGCSSTATITITVNPNPTVTASAIPSQCTYSSCFALAGYGSPAGGVWTGPGVSSGQFCPSVAGVGTHTLTYTYTNGNGCSSFATTQVVVLPGSLPATWPKFISGNNSRSFVKGVVSDQQGNVYITGYFSLTNSNFPTYGVIGATGAKDMFVIKYNEQCGSVWMRTISSSGSIAVGNDICVDNSGNVYVTGYFSGVNVNFGNSNLLSTVTGTTEAFLLKLNASTGTTTWVKKSNSPNSSSLSNAVGKHVLYSSVTNLVYWEGDFKNTVQFGTQTQMISNGGTDVFVAKYNTSGTDLWTTKIGSAYVTEPDMAGGIGVDATGNLYAGATVSGSVVTPAAFANNNGSNNIFIAKYNSSGTYLSGMTTGGTGTADDIFMNDMATDAGGRCYFTGSLIGSITLGASVTSATNAVYTTWVNSSLSISANWYNLSGTAAGTADAGNSITLSGTWVYVAGTTNPGVSTFPGFTPSTVSGSVASKEIFVCRMNVSTGAPDFLQFGVSTPDANNAGYSVSVNGTNGSVFTGGALGIGPASTTVSFNTVLTPQTVEQGVVVRSNSSSGFFRLANQDASADSLAAIETSSAATLYPNPTSGEVTIVFDQPINENATVAVYDALGNRVQNLQYRQNSEASIFMDLSALPNGIYFVQTSSGEKTSVQKLIINR